MISQRNTEGSGLGLSIAQKSHAASKGNLEGVCRWGFV